MTPIYALKDKVAGSFTAPTLSVNDSVAIRDFLYAAKHNDQLAFNITDFSLYRIGFYDQDTGILSQDEPVKIYDGRKESLDEI